MDKLTFATNKPVALALRALEGEPVESQFGGVQHRFDSDRGTFYVSEKVGGILTAQCRKLDVQPGDVIEICKAETDAGRGRKSIQWQVGFPAVEQQAPAPVRSREQAIAVVPQPSETPSEIAPSRPRWADVLIFQTNVIVDAYAASLAHASDKHGNAVKPEDVRSLLVTAFINLSKQGSGSHV